MCPLPPCWISNTGKGREGKGGEGKEGEGKERKGREGEGREENGREGEGKEGNNFSPGCIGGNLSTRKGSGAFSFFTLGSDGL